MHANFNITFNMNSNQTESDGRIINALRDPPGQYSAYISPGDPRTELYRITTFHKFPAHVPINPCNLANNGFFYTGYKDRVKCFDCAQSVDNWIVTDDPLSVTWHQPNCQMINRQFTTNVPLTAMTPMNFQQNHHDTPPISPTTSLAAINTTPPAPSTRNTTDNESNSLSTLITMFPWFPCNNPTTPCMRETQKRIDTFFERIHNWPQERFTATPTDMANAGLYYLGIRDRVKCFYCNGGLQNWDKYDDPWFEHAKWFPQCEFLLQQKGPEYVERVTNRFLHFTRPTLNNPVSLSATNDRYSSPTPKIIDPAETHRNLLTRIDTEIKLSPLTVEATTMGFSLEEIRQAFYKQLTEYDRPFANFSTLIHVLLDQQSATSDPDDPHKTDIYTTPKNTKPCTPRDELNMLKSQRQCKRCKTTTATIVCLPCGHLAACKICSQAITRCPVCMIKITEKIETYIA